MTQFFIFFIVSVITALTATIEIATAEDQCITKDKAAILASDYAPFGMTNGTTEIKQAGHFFQIWGTREGDLTGIHVSCSGEVTKMTCDAAKNCTTEKVNKCLTPQEAAQKINHAIRGGQVEGERFGDIERKAFSYVFFLTSGSNRQERRHAFVTCDGEVKPVSCIGECNFIPLKPWTTPATVRDFRTIEGSWYYCQQFIEDHAPYGLKSSVEMIIKMPAIMPEILLNGGLVGDTRVWSCKRCRHVKENPEPGGLPLECDAPGMPVKEKRN